MAYNQKQSKLVGVDNKLKTMRNIDPEGTLNAVDAGINGFVGGLIRCCSSCCWPWCNFK